MTEQWIAFVQEKWWIVLAAVVALAVVVSVVKTVIKWVLIAAIVGAVVLYGANYKEELTAVGDQLLVGAKEQAIEAFVAQTLNADYEAKSDGTFVVSTESVRVEGKEGSDEVTLYWNGVKVGTFQIDATIQAALEQAKNSK
ncbi:hypothetical protein [Paenibacillus sp.]|uniref:hypothetical protein n=1 Tax=Paenibacillus sp. TaxID=58172 RepID=UPI002D2E9090|nr:hypothetical protein [Paenibacillus sp.]HZG84610.1 hypothetical protein [Paenibacillus sp.]